jgi:NAD(P)-dependent dehydrogenase (short-subunit alcohol dehydrogenase family)
MSTPPSCTGLLRERQSSPGARIPSDPRRAREHATARFGRLSSPDEAAELARIVTSAQEQRWIIDPVIVVDGGRLLGVCRSHR